jgi:phospholipid/cholesterol/gamma-HCH transport system permease protein
MLGNSIFARGNAKIQRQEFAVVAQEIGVKELPILFLIIFLAGLIIAYVIVVQLSRFGAIIYVAEVVAISMMREMGWIMTGILMASHKRPAFAAIIGTMVVNDEIDVLQKARLSGLNSLILSGVNALAVMMQLFSVFSSFVTILEHSVLQYFQLI